MIDLPVLVVLTLVAYRATRLVVLDSLFDRPRDAVELFLLSRWHGRLAKLAELATCPFCVSVWMSLAAYIVWALSVHHAATFWLHALNVAAIAGGASMIFAGVDRA